MTLKDWKKTSKDTWETYESLHNGEFHKVWISPRNKDYVIIQARGFPVNPQILKRVKTRSQALKYAKAYMKKH